VGDPVGYIADKSGRGNHLTQADTAKRPVLRQDAGGKYYLEFDGVDDVLTAAAGSAFNGMHGPVGGTLMCAFQYAGTSTNVRIIGSPQSGASASSIGFHIRLQIGTLFRGLSVLGNGTTGVGTSSTGTGSLPIDTNAIVYGLHNGADKTVSARAYRDGLLFASAVDSYVFTTSSSDPPAPFGLWHPTNAGRIYQAISRVGSPLPAEDLDELLAWFADKSGVTLP
jgi:hypothetical protein